MIEISFGTLNLGLGEILGGGTLAALLGSIAIDAAPKIKLNPWKKIFTALGKLMNAEVLTKLAEVKGAQEQTQKRLDEHIQIDDERNADEHRAKILHFNNELLREIPHTEEDFIEVLAEIDFYESYCREHEDYKNNRAVHAIANIERVYDERLQKHDFL